MELILWRHADAEDGMPDEQRQLTDKGHKQAARMARWLKERLPDRFVLMASHARRAQETAVALSRHIETRETIYHARRGAELLQISGWPRQHGCVILVGHQPVLGAAAALLLCGHETDLSFRKGAVWWFEQRHGELALRAAIGPELV